MKLINIGFGSLVAAGRVLLVVLEEVLLTGQVPMLYGG